MRILYLAEPYECATFLVAFDTEHRFDFVAICGMYHTNISRNAINLIAMSPVISRLTQSDLPLRLTAPSLCPHKRPPHPDCFLHTR